MRVAKATSEDFEKTRSFLQACENIWDNRSNYSIRVEENEWQSWDDEDEDKILILKLRKEIADDEGCDVVEVDNRILMYEFIRRKYKKADCHWNRVIMAADILIDTCCDPQLTYLEWSPYYEQHHVAPEQ